MVASGPFAMGPSAGGASGSFRRNGESSTPILLNASRHADDAKTKDESGIWVDSDAESDAEEDEQKVDMRHVQKLDWSAPTALRAKSEKRPTRAKPEQGTQGLLAVENFRLWVSLTSFSQGGRKHTVHV